MKADNLTTYTEKCDIFSVGVIFYILLLGESPFQSQDYRKMLKLNKKCNIQFKDKKFEHVSE